MDTFEHKQTTERIEVILEQVSPSFVFLKTNQPNKKPKNKPKKANTNKKVVHGLLQMQCAGYIQR